MQVTVPKPDVKGRTEIINWYLKKIKVDPGVILNNNSNILLLSILLLWQMTFSQI